MLDVLRNHSCVNLPAETEPESEPEDCTAIPTISDLSNTDLDDSEPDTDLSASLSSILSILSISPAPEQRHLAMSDTAPKTPTTAVYRAFIYALPAPTDAHFCIYKQRTFLKFDKLGEPYFRIFEGAVDIASLPPKEQNESYGNLLTSIVATTDAPENRLAGCTEEVLKHYYLHLSRLASTRNTIRTLGLQHRTSAKRSYDSKLSPWCHGLLRNWQMGAASVNRVSAPRAFKLRAEQEREERGIMLLLDRCEEVLKYVTGFRPVDWRPATSKKMRWRDGRRGWRGLCMDDVGTANGGDDGEVRGLKVLREGVCRAVKGGMSGK